jgi:hypothetical protein
MKFTGSMRRALRVLDAGEARYSNFTGRGATDPDGNELGRSVYWQAADQLEREGLATITTAGAGGIVALTDLGREWLRKDEAAAR